MVGLPLRRALAGTTTLVVPMVLSLGFGHRGAHAARNLLLPGAGLIDERRALGALFVLATVGSVVMWMRWGADWMVLMVLATSIALSLGLRPTPSLHASPVGPVQAAHEFPVVVLVVGALSRLATITRRMPAVRRLRASRARRHNGLNDAHRLGAVDLCRTAALVSLAGDNVTARALLASPRVERRARRVSLVARGRRRTDVFRVDHAYARAPRRLCGIVPTDETRTTVGVPCSEPTWVRPLDGTLFAISQNDQASGVALLAHEFRLQRGHRPAWYWTPLGISAGRMTDWEHALTTGLARSQGWIGDDDWPVLRKAAMGAASRGTSSAHDERLIAAARLWLAFVNDDAAARIIMRPTLRHDPLAVSIDLFAQSIRPSRAGANP